MSLCDRTRAFVIPHGVARGRSRPAPAQNVLHWNSDELLRCALQRRGCGGVSVGDQQSEAVEQQVEGTRRGRRRGEGLDGAADLQQVACSGEVPGEDSRDPCDQVGLARELQVERLESPCGLQQ